VQIIVLCMKIAYILLHSNLKKVNYVFVPINMSKKFSHSKKFLQLLVLQKFFNFTFGLSFKTNSYL